MSILRLSHVEVRVPDLAVESAVGDEDVVCVTGEGVGDPGEAEDDVAIMDIGALRFGA